MSQAAGSHTSFLTIVPLVNYIGKIPFFCTARTNENIDMKAMANPLASSLNGNNYCHTLASPFSSICCHLLLGGFPLSQPCNSAFAMEPNVLCSP